MVRLFLLFGFSALALSAGAFESPLLVKDVFFKENLSDYLDAARHLAPREYPLFERQLKYVMPGTALFTPLIDQANGAKVPVGYRPSINKPINQIGVQTVSSTYVLKRIQHYIFNYESNPLIPGLNDSGKAMTYVGTEWKGEFEGLKFYA